MFKVPLQTELVIAIAECSSQLRFKSGKTPYFLANACQLVLEHGLHFRTSMLFLPQSQQFFDFRQREPQFLGMSYKCQIVNLLLVEQTISACAATRTLDESKLLIVADRVHSDAGQLSGRTDVKRL